MTEATALPVEFGLPSPAAALEQRYREIQRVQMDDVPILNAALQVQALGFQPWASFWLGVLVTPWFMNLVIFPRLPSQWPKLGERESRHYVFPAGVFEFIGSRDAVLGDFQACSLFSPMFEFADQASARATALAALQALFDAAHRESAPRTTGDEATTAAAAADAESAQPAAPATMSKRDFLRGGPRER